MKEKNGMRIKLRDLGTHRNILKFLSIICPWKLMYKIGPMKCQLNAFNMNGSIFFFIKSSYSLQTI